MEILSLMGQGQSYIRYHYENFIVNIRGEFGDTENSVKEVQQTEEEQHRLVMAEMETNAIGLLSERLFCQGKDNSGYLMLS